MSVRAVERAENAKKAAKIAAVVVGIVLIIAGAVYANDWLLKNRPKSVHWHPKWLVVVNDTEVAFSSPSFMQMGTTKAHIHQPDYKTIHFESRLEPWSFSSMFRDGKMGELSEERLVLAQGTSKPGTYVVNATAKVRVFHDVEKAEWTEDNSLIRRWLPEDGERILILYGDSSPQEIAAWQEKVPRAGAT